MWQSIVAGRAAIGQVRTAALVEDSGGLLK